jgi:hypothetical protein
MIFVKPWEEMQPFSEFVDFVADQERDGRRTNEEVRYAQTRVYYPKPFSFEAVSIPHAI